jgi:Uma2 family endonuclease
MPVVPNVPFFTLAPDWVCEVVSPSTGRLDRVRKLPIYLRERVSFVWLVDPLCKTVEAYQHNGEHWVILGVWSEEQTARIPPFDAVELDLTLWWLPEEGEASSASPEEQEQGSGEAP